MNDRQSFWKAVAVFCALVLFIVSMVFIIYQDQDSIVQENMNSILEETNPPMMEQAEETKETDATFIVDIKGAVQNPGIYEVLPNTRVHDVVELAGGFTENADEYSVNLAEKVYDEMAIIIYEKGEGVDSSIESPSGTKIKVNTATKEELMTLPNIGPSKAEAIIQYRDENGRFQKLEDLLNVSGIGEKTFEQLKEFIQIP